MLSSAACLPAVVVPTDVQVSPPQSPDTSAAVAPVSVPPGRPPPSLPDYRLSADQPETDHRISFKTGN